MNENVVAGIEQKFVVALLANDWGLDRIGF